MHKRVITFLLIAGCMISLCGCVNKTTNESGKVTNVSEEVGTRDNPADPYNGYTSKCSLGDENGNITIRLVDMWVGQKAVDEMETLGVEPDNIEFTYASNKDRGMEMALLKYTVSVDEGFKNGDFMPALFLLTSPYKDDFKTPVEGSQCEWSGLDGQIENAQRMGEGDKITGYISYIYEEETNVIYDNVYGDGSFWVEYDMK